MIHSVDLSEESWTLIDLYREGTGLGRSAAIEVLVGCALTQGLVMPQAPDMAQAISEVEVWDEPDPEVTEADAPDGGEEATGSSTPVSSGGSSEHSPDV